MKKTVEKMHVDVRAERVKRSKERQGPTVGVRQERVNYHVKKKTYTVNFLSDGYLLGPALYSSLRDLREMSFF